MTTFDPTQIPSAITVQKAANARSLLRREECDKSLLELIPKFQQELLDTMKQCPTTKTINLKPLIPDIPAVCYRPSTFSDPDPELTLTQNFVLYATRPFQDKGWMYKYDHRQNGYYLKTS
jgi:hypothetical protein